MCHSQTATDSLMSLPLRSQAEVQKRFKALIRKEGEVCRKNVTSYIRKATKGEHIITTIDGNVETEYFVKTDDIWVVCGRASGELYCITNKEFQEIYDGSSKQSIELPTTADPASSFNQRIVEDGRFMEYRSRRRVWAKQVDKDDMEFFRYVEDEEPLSSADDETAYFVAPWGASMRVEQGDYLVMQYPGDNEEIYRIERNAFHSSYSRKDTNDSNKQNPHSSPLPTTTAA